MADKKQTQAEKAEAKAHDAEVKAQNDAEAVNDAGMSKEEKKAANSAEAADDARAEAEQAKTEAAGKVESDTVETAGIVAPHVDPATPAGDVMAVKRGNDPANPQPLPGIPADYDGPTVRLTRVTPDKPGEPVVCDVHPEMVGDYLRAGWSRG